MENPERRSRVSQSVMPPRINTKNLGPTPITESLTSRNFSMCFAVIYYTRKMLEQELLVLIAQSRV